MAFEKGKDTETDEDRNRDLIEEPTPGCYIKSRYVLAFMMFLGMFNVYSLRVNLSVAIVAMVNSTQTSEDDTNGTELCPDRGASEIDDVSSNGIFDWDATQQGTVLGCYSIGYILTCVPGGYLAKRFGVKPVLGIAMFLSSIITLATPAMAYASYSLFVAFRVILGFLQGVSFPAVQSAWGRWAPPLERSQLVSISFSGSSFGTFITLPIAGIIADNLGWEAVYYFTVPGCKANTIDIAPKYGGIVYGVSNTFSNIPGFLAPQVAGLMLQDDGSLSQWQNVFWVSAAIYLVGAIFYLIVGTADVQPWAEGKLVKKNRGAMDFQTKL